MLTAFAPFPGFDPLDGDDPRVRLSPDNPCAPSVVVDGEAFEQEPDVND